MTSPAGARPSVARAGRFVRGAAAAATALALGAAGCGDRSAPAAPAAAGVERVAAAPVESSPHEHGRAIYNFRCYYCHGYSGDAKTLAATLVDPPPRNFAALTPDRLSRERMLAAVRDGVPGTAMAGFGRTLSALETERVVDFVREEFMRRKAPNTRYHTAANGWPQHERYEVAFPFATGEVALDTRWQDLTPSQQAGKRLYLSACVTCHDRARVDDPGAPWSLRGVSYPPGNYADHGEGYEGHALAGVPHDPHDPYEKHETPPQLVGLTPPQQRGEILFQTNCAYCHAADGSGKNWIGSFLDPSPPDFRRADVMQALTRERLQAATREGIAGSSMPAWKDVLSDAEIEAVVDYIERAWGTRQQAATSVAAAAPR